MSEFPPTYEQIIDLLKTTAKHAVNKFEKVSLEQYNARMDICNKCEFFVEKRCTKCGCYMEHKAKWEVAKCPEKFW